MGGIPGKKGAVKGQISNGLFSAADGQDPSQQFADPSGGLNSRSNHKRPKSNLDGFLKSSKQGPINSNELPQIEVQNRNFMRQANKTPVVQQSHQVQSK